MKRVFFLLCSLFILILFSSCNFALPTKISIKTKAKYNFSLGDFEYNDLAEKFKPAEMIPADQLPEGASLYDYFPGKEDKNTQRLLMSLPITSIPIDFSSYFENTDLNENIQGMNFQKTITAPAKIEFTQEHDLDMSSINDAINAGVSIGGSVNAAESGVIFAANGTNTFSKISYSSGYFEISEMVPGSIPDGVTVTLSDVITGLDATGTFLNGKANVSLNGKAISRTGLKIKFSTTLPAAFLGFIKSGKIETAEGLTVDQSIAETKINVNIPTFTISQNADAGYKECTVGTGSLNVSMAVPWPGVTMKYKIATSGGLVIDDDVLAVGNKIIDLNGRTLYPQDIVVTPTIDIELNDATISFATNPKIQVGATVTAVDSIIAEIDSEEFNPKIDKTQPLPAELLEYVQSMKFAKCGLKGTYINTLPAGNSVTIESTCKFFGIENDVFTLLGGKTEEEPGELEITGTDRTITFSDTPDNTTSFNEIKFEAEIKLPNSSGGNSKEFKITGVRLGETYTIGVNIEPVLDWEEITIKTSGGNQKAQMDTGMNIGSIFDSFEEGIGEDSPFKGKFTIQSLPIYLYVVKPNIHAFDDCSFTGSLKAYYGKLNEISGEYDQTSPAGKEVDFMDVDGTIPFVANMPELKFEKLYGTGEDDPVTVVSNLANQPASVKKDLASFADVSLIPEGSTIIMDYDLGLSESGGNGTLTISKEDFDEASNNVSEIAINAILVLPLRLVTTDEINMNLLSLREDSEGDLFGRTEATDTSETEEYINLIKSVTLNYSLTEKPFYTNKIMKLHVDFGDGGDTYELGDGEVEISSEAIANMLTVVPFKPVVELQIADDTIFSVPRDMKLKAKLNLAIETDGTIKVFEKEGGQ